MVFAMEINREKVAKFQGIVIVGGGGVLWGMRGCTSWNFYYTYTVIWWLYNGHPVMFICLNEWELIMDLHCRSARFSRCFPHDESGQHFLARTRNNKKHSEKGTFYRDGCKNWKDYLPGNFHIPPPKAAFEEDVLHIPRWDMLVPI